MCIEITTWFMESNMKATIVKNENGNGDAGILGLLGVAFVVLKLTEVIDWSWIWVLAPFWGGFVLGIFFFFIVVILGTIFGNRRL